MSYNLLYHVLALSYAVHLMPTEGALAVILEKFFRKKKIDDSSLLAWDIVYGNQALLPNLSIYAPAVTIDTTETNTVEVTAPVWSPKTLIDAAFFDSLRGAGTNEIIARIEDKNSEKLRILKNAIDTTLNYCAVQALSGNIVDKNGKVVASWDVPASHSPDRYTGAQAWTHDDSKPTDDIRALKYMITRAVRGGVTEWIGLAGKNVVNALLHNKSFGTTYNGIITLEKAAQLLEIDEIIEGMDAYYINDDGITGDAVSLVGDDEFKLVGYSDMFFSERIARPANFAAIMDDRWRTLSSEADQNIPMDVLMQMKYAVKSWEEDDPDGRWLRVTNRSLPVVMAPGAVATLKPIAAT